jgi:RNA polymerase sigma-70 factor (ECF subfamily)
MVDAHYTFLWRALRGLGVPAESADDAAQSVLWIAAQKLALIAPGSERSFLFATARGVAANMRRARAHAREVLDEGALHGHMDGAPSPEERVAREQHVRILESILEALDEDLRTVFVLFELEGLTMIEIAALLELAQGTVASRLRRAREEFQAASKRYLASARGAR